MADGLLVTAGTALVLLSFVDAFMTTLAVSAGAGPVTSRVLAVAWRGMLALHHQDARSTVLRGAGTLLLTTAVLLWVVGLWVGWTLVFLGSGAVVSSSSPVAASAGDVAYFAGFTVFTLGTGDFVADAPGWRVLSAVASFSGLFLVTLAITYLISVVSAVVARRALAAQIHGMGDTAPDLVTQAWSESDFSAVLEQQLVGLTPSLVHSAEQHLAYPVLHYFHASERRLAAPSAIAHLDDALYLLAEGVGAGHRPDHGALRSLRHAVDHYANTAAGVAWLPTAEAPPRPTLDVLHRCGIPTVDTDTFARTLDRDATRRTRLHQLVTSDGWSWPEPTADHASGSS